MNRWADFKRVACGGSSLALVTFVCVAGCSDDSEPPLADQQAASTGGHTTSAATSVGGTHEGRSDSSGLGSAATSTGNTSGTGPATAKNSAAGGTTHTSEPSNGGTGQGSEAQAHNGGTSLRSSAGTQTGGVKQDSNSGAQNGGGSTTTAAKSGAGGTAASRTATASVGATAGRGGSSGSGSNARSVPFTIPTPDATQLANTASLGGECRAEHDHDGNGTVDSIAYYTRDSRGLVVLEERDINADGVAEWKTTYTYDAAGNRTKFVQDTDLDGVGDYWGISYYDESELLVRDELYREDLGASPYSVTVRTYTDDGRELAVENLGPSGQAVSRSGNVYDKGVLVGYSQDDNADGQPEVYTKFTLDSQGRVVLAEQDAQNNGTIDAVNKTTYDDVAHTEVTEYLSPAGEIAHTMRFQYDDKGNLLAMSDRNSGGYVVTGGTWERDKAGNLLRVVAVQDGVHSEQRLAYDCPPR